ncbi:Structural maintenance of chromosomes protein [Salix suchowensis]|nr:Structural maintenance of chromosomes protein [Salix suchowensis]
MDAISFVLGVKSAQLRSSQLKDLVYRGRRLGRNGAEGSEAQEEDEGKRERERGRPRRLGSWPCIQIQKRKVEIPANDIDHGASEYKLNNKVVTYTAYNAALVSHNILVKAKNFLVFQGDVEAVASQSPRELSRLIEQISGSLELAAEYEKAKEAQDRATENATFNFTKRRGIAGEIKQYKEQKGEAERFEALCQQKDELILRRILYKLYHIEEAIDDNTREINSQNNTLAGLREQQRVHDEALEAARLNKRRRAQADRRTDKPLHQEAQQAQKNREELEKSRDALQSKVDALQKELMSVKKAAKTAQVSESLTREEKTTARSLNQLQQKYEGFSERRERIAEDGKAQSARKAEVSHLLTLELIDGTLNLVGRKTVRASERPLEDQARTGQSAVRKDKNRVRPSPVSRLALLQLTPPITSSYQPTRGRSEREAPDSVRPAPPSWRVRGRVIDLCKPTQRKYETAVSVVLGRNIDAVVVDEERTAIDCIEYMRNQRAGQATFIPLDTIQVKPINDKFRSFAKGARLAVDVIQYEPAVERAMHHACGNALVCDTMEVARYVCYEKGRK